MPHCHKKIIIFKGHHCPFIFKGHRGLHLTFKRIVMAWIHLHASTTDSKCCCILRGRALQTSSSSGTVAEFDVVWQCDSVLLKWGIILAVSFRLTWRPSGTSQQIFPKLSTISITQFQVSWTIYLFIWPRKHHASTWSFSFCSFSYFTICASNKNDPLLWLVFCGS